MSRDRLIAFVEQQQDSCRLAVVSDRLTAATRCRCEPRAGSQERE
jgi:hypothetical protein